MQIRETELTPGQPISISRENSERAGSPLTTMITDPHPDAPPMRESTGPRLNTPNEADSVPAGILPRQSNGGTNPAPASTFPVELPQKAPSRKATKDMDYRVQGIKLEYAVPDLLSYLSRKLGIEPTVVGRIKALSTSQTGDKVAIIAWRPQPACLSAPGMDEWHFGPTSDDDDIHITVDTHFRGVTVLYSPPPDIPHMIE